MTYCTIGDLRNYLGISVTTDDILLQAIIARAQKTIETHTNRIFECTTDESRYFDVSQCVYGNELFFDDDLCQFAASDAVITNADNASPTVLTLYTDFITMPRNTTPWFSLVLLASSSHTWTYSTNPEFGVKITGRWAYSVTPPADIVHATIRLAAYFYRQKDAQVFDVTAVPDAGILTIPKGIPEDVRLIIERYWRYS